ncbi:phosphatase PAP2 family protein [Tsukamurella sp. 1534]|uniref:acid phosphatase n=1 Tax=Tsukamurella sp. 1534 TaxID=1151061 RepID=UPI000595456C|nr:phosphatase PAP2 family protein [Tsukamurella sp. 1534]
MTPRTPLRSIRQLLAAVLAATALATPTVLAATPADAAPTSTFAGTGSTGTAPSASVPTAPAVSAKTHIAELAAFSDLPRTVLDANLETTVDVNNAATASEQRAAIADNYDIDSDAIFTALGSRLYPAFKSAQKAGRLPKTTALLLGRGALVNGYVSTSAAKKHFHNPRPFEVAPDRIRRYDNARGDLYASVRGSGSYPSGHTAWGYAEAIVLAQLLPELGPQILARGAEYGRHRVVLGVHYPLDVIGGRILAQAAVAEALGDAGFAARVAEAARELRAALGTVDGRACGQGTVETGAARAAYRRDLSWDLPRVGGDTPARVPAGAIALLRAAHPGWSDEKLRDTLARTAAPGGAPLDVPGGWQRIDLLSAWIAR